MIESTALSKNLLEVTPQMKGHLDKAVSLKMKPCQRNFHSKGVYIFLLLEVVHTWVTGAFRRNRMLIDIGVR